MRKSLATALVLLIAGGFAGTAPAADLDINVLKSFADQFPFAILYGDGPDGELKFIYADRQAHVHVLKVEDGTIGLDWENTNLGSRVASIFVTDLYGDESDKLVIGTAGGRILIYQMDGYDLDWENLQDPFDQIEYMISKNIDDDPQEELIFIADRTLYIYDSLKKTIDWQSQDEYSAKQIITGNVDDDDQLEIITNTGIILDSRFYNVEFQSEEPFGDRIFLLDINNDGIPEIAGESLDFNLRFFDVYAEREIW